MGKIGGKAADLDRAEGDYRIVKNIERKAGFDSRTRCQIFTIGKMEEEPA